MCPPFPPRRAFFFRSFFFLFWEYLCYDGLWVLTPKSKGWRLAVGCVQWGNRVFGSLSFFYSPALIFFCSDLVGDWLKWILFFDPCLLLLL